MAKRRKKRNSLIVFFGVVILIGIAICIYVYLNSNHETPIPDDKMIANQNEEQEDSPKLPQEYKLDLVMMGDALIHGSVYKDAYSDGKYDFTKQIALLKPIISSYDLAFYNQETILGGTELGLSDYPTFNSPYEVGDAMIDAGFDLVSLATNHTMDSGEKAVINSCAYWAKQKNIVTSGSYCSWDDRNEVKIYEKNNITYALLAYTFGTNGIPIPKGKEYLVNVFDEEQAKKDIEAVRDKVDVVLVSMHWGVEYTNKPVESQIEQAKYLASLGVDIIIGTHPHVVEPVTWIDDTLVIYSLGNMISAQYQDDNYNKMVGLMTSVDITKTVTDSNVSIKIDNVNNELVYNYYKNWRGFKVIPFSQMTSDYLSNYEDIYNRYSKVVKMYDETMPVVALS